MIVSKLLLFLALIGMYSCNAQDTSFPQFSKSVEESKKLGLFLKEFYVSGESYDSLIVEEAWIEQGSFNKKTGETLMRKPENWCQLCFTIKQFPEMIFRINNRLDWSMVDPVSDKFVGVHAQGNGLTGVYFLMFDNCNIPASISIDLYKKDVNGKRKVGQLMFKSK